MRGICIEKLIIYNADGRMKVQGHNYPSLNNTTEGWKKSKLNKQKKKSKNMVRKKIFWLRRIWFDKKDPEKRNRFYNWGLNKNVHWMTNFTRNKFNEIEQIKKTTTKVTIQENSLKSSYVTLWMYKTPHV